MTVACNGRGMKLYEIMDVKVQHVSIPLKSSFTTSFGKSVEKHALIIKLTIHHESDETKFIGWGEAPTDLEPRYSGEFLDGAESFLTKIISKHLNKFRFEDLQQLHEKINEFRGNNMAKAAIEFAAADAISKQRRMALVELLWELAHLGKPTRDRIPVGISLGIPDSRDPKDLVTRVTRAVNKGYHKIKIKIEPGWDVEPLKAIRDSHPDISLMVDGNGGYLVEKHHQHLTTLDQFELLMIEQPYQEDAFLDHQRLQREMSTPICLDESLKTPQFVKLALELDACRVVNLKPARVGGVINSLAIHQIADEYKVPAWVGGMLETGIGRAFNVALATLPNFTIPGDISETSRYFDKDIIPYQFQLDGNGMLAVPTLEKGLGIPINENYLQQFTIAGGITNGRK